MTMTHIEFFRSLDYENGFEVTEKIFRRLPMQYGVTLGLDGKPQIRPLEFKFAEKGRFYFDTVETYTSYKEMQKTPYIQICIGDQESMSYLRLSGKVNFTRDKDIVDKCFANSRVLTEQFSSHREQVIAYYLTEMKAEFATFLPGLKSRKYDLGAEAERN